MNHIPTAQSHEQPMRNNQLAFVDAAHDACGVAEGCATLLRTIADDMDNKRLHHALWVMIRALRATASELREAADKVCQGGEPNRSATA
jgi:hypothetical protein